MNVEEQKAGFSMPQETTPAKGFDEDEFVLNISELPL
jgi:hypothetical protein